MQLNSASVLQQISIFQQNFQLGFSCIEVEVLEENRDEQKVNEGMKVSSSSCCLKRRLRVENEEKEKKREKIDRNKRNKRELKTPQMKVGDNLLQATQSGENCLSNA
jgi:hypothetical protein